MALIRGKQIENNSIPSSKVDQGGTISTINAGDAAVSGNASGLAVKDHQHAVSTSAASEISDATNSEGVSTSLARADHGHAHGNRGGGTLHAVATIASAGFLSATDKAKLDALIDPNMVSAKNAVRALALSPITLSGLQTIDGVVLVSGDRVAVFNTGPGDGIYTAVAGAWTRESDFPLGVGQSGAVFSVEEGTVNGDTLWQVTSDSGSDVPGTNTINVAKIGQGAPRTAGAGLQLVGNELSIKPNADGSIVADLANGLSIGTLNSTQHGNLSGGMLHAVAIPGGANGFLSGADKLKLDGITAAAEPNRTPHQEVMAVQVVTGTDTALTANLSFVPVPASLELFLNGVFQTQGAGKDYTIAGSTITWLASTGTAVDLDLSDELVASYVS